MLKTMRSVRYYSMFFLLFLITSCHYSIDDTLPVFGKPQSYTTDEGITFSITPVSKIAGNKVSKYLTVFYVEINNNSDKSIKFGSSDIVIIDQLNTQYNPLNAEYAANIIKENSPPRIYPRFSVGIGTGYFSDYHYFYGRHHFWPYTHFPYYYDDYYYNDYYYRTQNVDYIYRNALIPGTVKSGARLSGFVYFNKIPKNIHNIKMNMGYGFVGSSTRKEISFDLYR